MSLLHWAALVADVARTSALETRDDKGVLVAEFHSNGGPFLMNAQAHTEFVDAFYRIGQDQANKIVILTGGGEFITDVDWTSFGDVADPSVWSQIHDEGLQVLENIANIRVPVIAAVEGRAHIHSDYALLASVIVAAEGATFQDVGHFAAGVAPGDGIFTTWSYRASAAASVAPASARHPPAQRHRHQHRKHQPTPGSHHGTVFYSNPCVRALGG
jgi:enoyl-CoA hydratase/carnithine racemase